MDRNTSAKCGHKSGELEQCAPLAVAFVPFQQENPPTYDSGDALTHGTLFPGLDLPFMNLVNKTNPYVGTPLGELMALDFAINELNLYLDTHADDTDAFEMLKAYIVLSKKGKAEYIKKFGPITIMDMEIASKYTWLDGPWPWEFREGLGG